MTATPEAINSIEWAVLFAALVLSARLYSLVQASLGVDRAHAQVLDGLSRGDLTALERRTRGLGYQNPYGEFAAELINAAHREGVDESKRREYVARALTTMIKRWARRTKQGRVTDILALGIGCIVVIYSRGLLPEGPLFWSCTGAMFVTLVATFGARGVLLSNLSTSGEGLKNALLNRPQLPSLTEGDHPCLWCGSSTLRAIYRVQRRGDDETVDIEMSQCDTCGKLVGTLDCDDDPESSDSEKPSAPNSVTDD